MAEQEFKHLVRIVNTDLDGKSHIVSALRKIKGVSFAVASAVCNIAGIDKQKKAGYLDDGEITKLDDVLRNCQNNLPVWMLNRRKDYESGINKHLLMSELEFARQEDIRRMQRTRSYKGIRHALGLPVRGQRTRSNFRRNKGKVLGVIKKRVMAAQQKDREDKKGKE